METTPLTLFKDKDFNTIHNIGLDIPLIEVLEEATPKSPNFKPSTYQVSDSLKKSLDELFPEQQYDEKDIQKAKEILGSLVLEFTPQQLKDTVTEIQYLTESWLDDFERQIFGGLTLQELLHEKGGK